MAITQIDSNYGVASNEFDFDDTSLDIVGETFEAAQGNGTVHISCVTALGSTVPIIGATLLTQGSSTTDGKVFTTAEITPSPNKLIVAVCVSSGDHSGGYGTPVAYGCDLDFKTISPGVVETNVSRVTTFRAQSGDPKTGTLTFRFDRTQKNCQWGVFELSNVPVSVETDGTAAVVQESTSSNQGPGTAMSRTLNAFANAKNAALGVFGFHDAVNSAPTVTVGTDFTELVEQTSNEATGPESGGVYAEIRTLADITPDATLSKSMDWAAVGAEIKAILEVDVSSAITSWSATKITLDLTSLSAALRANLAEDLGPGQRYIVVTTNDQADEFASPAQAVHREKAFTMAASSNIAASGENTTAQLIAPGSAFGDLVTSPPQSLYEPTETAAQLVFTQAPVKGNLLILLHHASDGNTQTMPTDGGTGQWFEVPSSGSDAAGGEYRIYYKIAFGDEVYVEGHSETAAEHLLICYEVIGPWNAALLDVHASDSSQTTTAFDTTVTGTTAIADSFAVVLAGGKPTTFDAALDTWQDSYVEDIDPGSLQAVDTTMGGAHKVLTATGTARGQATWDSTHGDACGIVAVFSGRDPIPSGAFGGGRIQDDENPGDTVDLAANEFREDEWCIQALSTSEPDKEYQFRVLVDGVPASRISQIPRLTILSGTVTATGTITFSGDLAAIGEHTGVTATSTITGDLAGTGLSLIYAVGTITITGDLVSRGTTNAYGTITALGQGISEGTHNAFGVITFIGQLIAGGGVSFAAGTSTITGDLAAAEGTVTVPAAGTITVTGDLVSDGKNLAAGTSTFIGDLAAIGQSLGGIVTALGTSTFIGDLAADGKNLAAGTSTIAGDLVAVGTTNASGTITALGQGLSEGTHLASGTITCTGDLAAIGQSLQSAVGTSTITGDLAADGKNLASGTSIFIGDLAATDGLLFSLAFGTSTFIGDLAAVGEHTGVTATSTFIGDLAAIGTDTTSGEKYAVGTITFTGDLTADSKNLSAGTSTFSGALSAIGTALQPATATITVGGGGIGNFTYIGGDDSQANSNTASLTHGLTINDGDLIVVYMNVNHRTDAITPNQSGWTEASDFTPGPGTPEETCRTKLYWKVASSEPATWTWDLTNTVLHGICFKVFRPDAGTPVVDATVTTHYDSQSRNDLECRAGNGVSVSDKCVSIICGGKDNRGSASDWTSADNSYVSSVGAVGGSQYTGMAHRIYTSDDTAPSVITISGTDVSDLPFSTHISFVASGGGERLSAVGTNLAGATISMLGDTISGAGTLSVTATSTFIGDLAAIGTDLTAGTKNATGTSTFSSDVAASGTQLAGGTSTFSGQLVAVGVGLQPAVGTITITGDLAATGTTNASGTITALGQGLSEGTHLAAGTITATGDLAATGISLQPVTGTSTITGDLAAVGEHTGVTATSTFIGDLAAIGTALATTTDAAGTITVTGNLVAGNVSLAFGTSTIAGDLAAIGQSIVPASGTITVIGEGISDGTELASGTITFSGELAADSQDVTRSVTATITVFGSEDAAGVGFVYAAGTITITGDLPTAIGSYPATTGIGTISFIGSLYAEGINFCPITASGTINLIGSLVSSEDPSDNIVTASAGGVLRTYQNYDTHNPPRQMPLTGSVSVWHKPGIVVGMRQYFGPFVKIWGSDGDPDAVAGGSDDEWVWREDNLSSEPPFTLLPGSQSYEGHYFVRNVTQDGPPLQIEYDYSGVYVFGEYYYDEDGGDISGNRILWNEGDEWEVLWRDFTPTLKAKLTHVYQDFVEGAANFIHGGGNFSAVLSNFSFFYFGPDGFREGTYVRNVTQDTNWALVTDQTPNVVTHDAFSGAELWMTNDVAHFSPAPYWLAKGTITVKGELPEAELRKVSCIRPTGTITMSGGSLAAFGGDLNQKYSAATITWSASLDVSAIYARAEAIAISGSLSAQGRLLADGALAMHGQAIDLSMSGQIGAGTIDGQKTAIIREAYGSLELYNNSQGGFYSIGGSAAVKEGFGLINVTSSVDALGSVDQTKFALGSILVTGDLDTTEPITSVTGSIITSIGDLAANGEHTGVTATSTFSGDLAAAGEVVVNLVLTGATYTTRDVFAFVQYKVDNNGNCYANQGFGYVQVFSSDNWIRPVDVAPGSYKIRATKTSGSDPTAGAALGVWHALTNDRFWENEESGFKKVRTSALLIEISLDEVEILASASIVIRASTIM